MKTKILAILSVLMLTITLSYAKDPQSILQQSIKDQVKYQTTAAEKLLEGAVFVEFSVTADGKLNVINCTSIVGELQSYVFKTISAMTVFADPAVVGKTFLMRFDFKLE